MTYLPRTAADPVMNQIAKRLMDVQWQFDLTTDEENACLELEKDPRLPKRMITLMRDYKTWVIRVCIAGVSRAVGYYSNAKTNTLTPAFRYSDMIRMYFWAYKRRDAYEPTDSDLNISAERAKLDLVHETEVVQIIKDIEAHLISIGAIVPPSEMEQQTREKNKGRWAKPTLKGSLADAAEVHRMALAGLREEVGSLTSQVRALVAQGLSQEALLKRILDTFTHAPAFSQPIMLPPQPPLFPSAPYRPLPQQPQIVCAGEEEVEAAPCS